MSDAVARLNVALQGRYAIERELGEGGMATVYLANDLKHGRKVALKVLKPELAAVIGAERFLAEIKTTANLQHPHILPLFDSGAADGLLYYIMPLIDGESLSDKLKRETQLPVDEALEIAEAVAGALDYAHRQGVVHRDIKPANFSRTGSVVYVAGGFERSLVLVERTGREVLLTEERLGYRFPRFSPDGRRVSVAVDPRPSTLWLFDVGSGVGSPIEGGQLSFWNPANGRLYAGEPLEPFLVERWPLTSSPDTAMIWPVSPIFIRSWSRDGLTLIAAAPGVDTGQDLWHVQLGGDGIPDTLMATPFEERDAKLSPDGNWLVYESDLSGRPEIYLTTYPDLRDRQRGSPRGRQHSALGSRRLGDLLP